MLSTGLKPTSSLETGSSLFVQHPDLWQISCFPFVSVNSPPSKVPPNYWQQGACWDREEGWRR